jgi:hypothetical protein
MTVHTGPAAVDGRDREPDAVWDNEGGHLVEARAHRSGKSHPAAVSG